MFQLIEKKGDIFTTCPASLPLAHCVSRDFRMAAGVALTFRQKYGQIAFLKSQVQQIGQCAIMQHENRWLFYLVTKNQYFLKPTYYTLEQALWSLRRHMTYLQLHELAIPGYMASHRDKLDWEKVKQIICKVFGDTNVTIYVYYL